MIRRPPSWPQPEVLDSVKSLKWYATTIADGVQSGMHVSRRLAVGMEFDQYRQYTPGDDLRLLDWKKYARTGKYYLRQSAQENAQSMAIYLDTSPSMKYSEDGISKLDTAKVITACISLVLLRQGDRCGWSGGITEYPLGGGMMHWHRMTDALHELGASEDQAPQTTPVKELLYISDFYDALEDIEASIKDLILRQGMLRIIHLVGRQEEGLDFQGNLAFVDLETQERVVLSPKLYKERYATALAAHHHSIKQLCYRYGVTYHKVYMQDDIGNSIRDLLNYNLAT